MATPHFRLATPAGSGLLVNCKSGTNYSLVGHLGAHLSRRLRSAVSSVPRHYERSISLVHARWSCLVFCCDSSTAHLDSTVTLYNAFVPRKPSRRDTQEIIAERERRRRFGSPALDARVRSLQSLLFFADVVLFLLGNWWYFSSETCSATAPTLYKSALAALILSWLGLAEFVLTVLAILVCLPLVLLFFRASGIRPGQNEVGPLDEKEINKLPRKIFL